MADRPFDELFDELIGEYANRGVRPFDRHAIAAAAIELAPRRTMLLGANSRRALLGLVAVLLLAAVGAALVVGAQWLRPVPAPLDRLGGAGGLIVLTPDARDGTIRVLRPDGTVVAEAPGSTNGCDRLVLTPDGERLAWIFQDGPVHIAPLDGSEHLEWPPSGEAKGSWAFSPDRTRFAYLVKSGDSADLAIVSLASGSATVVASDLQDVDAVRWSVTDTLALGVVTATEIGIDLIAADGTNRRALVRQPFDGVHGKASFSMSWSPDGSRLAYLLGSGRLGDPLDTRLIDVATGSSVAVATADGQPVSPWMVVANTSVFAWSPDRRQVAYPAGDGFALLDLATGESRVLADVGVMPLWSPDASRIALVRASDPARIDIFDADLTGRVEQVVDGEITGRVAWSPDGRVIAARVGVPNELDVFLELLDPDGVEASVRISSDITRNDCLTWWATGPG